MRTLHPAAFWRPGDFLLPGTRVPHAFPGKHDSHFKPPGRGRTADPSAPLSRRHKKPPCVGADAHIGPLKRTPCKKYVIARAHRARGEQTERCQWQKKRGERVAAVKISSVRREAAQKFWAPQQGHPRPLSPPFRQGRLIFPRVQAPPGVHKHIKQMKGKKR